MSAAQTPTLAPLVHAYTTSRHRQGTYSAESLRTVRPRLDTLTRSFGRRPLEHLNRKAIERWLEGLAHLTTNSRASYVATVRHFTRWLVAEGHIEVDPCADLPRLKRTKSVPRAQTPERVAKVLDACQDERERAIVLLMVQCGLRRAEVARARWEDYDSVSRTLLVHGKGQTERLLPVPAEAADALTALHTSTSGPIIRSHADGHSPVTPTRIGQLMVAAMRRAGIKLAAYDGVSGHALRHTAASDVLDACGDLRTVQQMLGHVELTSTAIYLRRASANQIRDAVEGRTYRPAEQAAS